MIYITLISVLARFLQTQTVDYSIDLVLNGASNTATYSKGDHFSAEIVLDQTSLSIKDSEVLLVGSDLKSLKFSFINGLSYTEMDDPSNGFPRAFFEDGRFIGCDFWNSKGLTGGGKGSFFRFIKDGSFQYSPEGANEYSGAHTHSVKAVPECSSSFMCLLGLSYLVLVRM